MKKSQVSILLIMALLISIFSLTIATAQASDIYLYVGSEFCQVADKEVSIDKANAITPYIKNSRTMVPIRFLSENLGYIVTFNYETQTAFLEKENNKIAIKNGESVIAINGVETAIEAPSEIRNSRLFVPLRVISEATGQNVDYKKGLVSVRESTSKITEDDYNNIVDKISPAKKVVSEKQAKELLEKYGGQNYYGRMFALEDSKAATAAPSVSGTAEKGEDKFSTTNTQVDGVDEADIIKTDGKNIYTIVANTVKIIKPDPLEILSTINKDNNFFMPNQLYIDNDRLVVVGFEYEEPKVDDKVYTATAPAVDSKMAIMPYFRQNNYTKVMIYDVSNPIEPKLLRETKVEGDTITTRKIGDNLYFITNKWIYNGGIGIMPMVKEDGVEKMSPVTRLSYFPNFTQNNIVTVASLNVADTAIAVRTESFLGGGENVFVSNNNLYIAVTNFQTVNEKGEYTNSQSTKIYRFALDNGEIFLNGTGEVGGTVLNQFSMDEYDSYFRIATNIQTWTESQNVMKNQLFVLDETMNISGSILDIAPGERIYSTRFLGEKGYMVTFRNVDPFFAIDLSDHKNPKIMGALKIPGFSDYLHPYDENTIIGFGKDTAIVKNQWSKEDMAIPLGFKLSAFDVTDFVNPVESFKEIIGDRGTNSEVSYNHKALLVDKETGLFAFPIDVYETKDKTNIEEYGQFAYQGLYLFKFSKENGFQKVGRITHLTNEDLLKAGNYGFDSQSRISRAVYIGEKLYTLSENLMVSHNINTLEKISEVKFK